MRTVVVATYDDDLMSYVRGLSEYRGATSVSGVSELRTKIREFRGSVEKLDIIAHGHPGALVFSENQNLNELKHETVENLWTRDIGSALDRNSIVRLVGCWTGFRSAGSPYRGGVMLGASLSGMLGCKVLSSREFVSLDEVTDLDSLEYSHADVRAGDISPSMLSGSISESPEAAFGTPSAEAIDLRPEELTALSATGEKLADDRLLTKALANFFDFSKPYLSDRKYLIAPDTRFQVVSKGVTYNAQTAFSNQAFILRRRGSNIVSTPDIVLIRKPGFVETDVETALQSVSTRRA